MKFQNTIEIISPEKIVFTYKIADIGTRAVAYIIDLFFMLIVMFIIVSSILKTTLNQSSSSFSQMGYLMFFSFYFLFRWFYFIFCEIYFNGKSIGKKLLKISVIKIDGTNLDLYSITIRNFMRVIEEITFIPVIGALICFVDKKRRRLGDLLAQTIVVYDISFNLELPEYNVSFKWIDENITKNKLILGEKRLNEKQLYVVRSFLKNFYSLPFKKRYKIGKELADKISNYLDIKYNENEFLKFLERVYKAHENDY